ncbi:MAG: CvpA family protein [Bacteroidales bacterium]|nr:CvpA family protein [Bacteroidales bacterium]
MQLIDILLAIPLLFFIYKGWKKGLVQEVATLVGLIAGIWACVHLSQQVAEWLNLDSENSILIAFIITFIAVLVLTYLLGRCVEGLLKAAKLSLLNRLAGALLGAVKALCILAVLLNYVVMFDKQETVLKPDMKKSSLLYRPVYNVGNRLTASLKQFINDHKEEWKEAVK